MLCHDTTIRVSLTSGMTLGPYETYSVIFVCAGVTAHRSRESTVASSTGLQEERAQ